jgi:hypothetical protein
MMFQTFKPWGFLDAENEVSNTRILGALMRKRRF